MGLVTTPYAQVHCCQNQLEKTYWECWDVGVLRLFPRAYGQSALVNLRVDGICWALAKLTGISPGEWYKGNCTP